MGMLMTYETALGNKNLRIYGKTFVNDYFILALVEVLQFERDRSVHVL